MEENKNIIPTVEKVIDSVVDTATVGKKWTFKRVMLYIFTLYFLIIILKYLGIFIWKTLGFLRRYIHDLTDEHKFAEVILWTVIGIGIGVILSEQIRILLNEVVTFFNDSILPFIFEL